MRSKVKKLLCIDESLLAWNRVYAHLYKNLTICNEVHTSQTLQLLPESDLPFSLEIVICQFCLSARSVKARLFMLFGRSACVSVFGTGCHSEEVSDV